jgi:4-hydroxythreonine-4-phosphate dehydrogenase
VPFNLINKNFKISELKNNQINLINVDFKFSHPFKKISKISKQYNEKSFLLALGLMKRKIFSGMINGPITKKYFLNKKYFGITEYLAKKTKTKNFAMLIYNKKLAVSPLTTHLPLKNVNKFISKKQIIKHAQIIKKFYKINFKKNPKIAITGLNPHCESTDGKNSEENKIIIPALKKLKKIFSNISGPYPADSLFMKRNIKKFDVVIGMYHDQVLTPIKSIYNFDAINITLGLPFIRISPDHGPNSQMVGKNKSNPESLISAIKFLEKN